MLFNTGKKLAESRPAVMSLSITEKLHVLLFETRQSTKAADLTLTHIAQG
jgi:hypothetical protein